MNENGIENQLLCPSMEVITRSYIAQIGTVDKLITLAHRIRELP